MTSPLQSIVTITMLRTESGISYADYADSGREGYSVIGADASSLSGDTLVLPESVDGKGVIHLGNNFLSEFRARRVDLGAKIAGVNADAFFDAKDLEEIVSHSRAFTVSNDDPALYIYQHSFLLDYPSTASDGEPYTVHEGTKAIYSMNHPLGSWI